MRPSSHLRLEVGEITMLFSQQRIEMPEAHDEEHAEPAPELAALSFLTGRFRGEGLLVDGGERYEKDVTGRWVAGGHHLLLEMTARYSDGRGRRDQHSAVVVVSAGEDTGLVSVAYTDGGEVIRMEPKATAAGIEFEDEVPHGSGAARARKILHVTDGGYREIFEVDRGDGVFDRYASVDLHRIDG